MMEPSLVGYRVKRSGFGHQCEKGSNPFKPPKGGSSDYHLCSTRSIAGECVGMHVGLITQKGTFDSSATQPSLLLVQRPRTLQHG